MGDLASIPGLRRSPGGGHGNPLQYSCLENPHERRSLAGQGPWGHKESDMTKHSTQHNLIYFISIQDFWSWDLSIPVKITEDSPQSFLSIWVLFSSIICCDAFSSILVCTCFAHSQCDQWCCSVCLHFPCPLTSTNVPLAPFTLALLVSSKER